MGFIHGYLKSYQRFKNIEISGKSLYTRKIPHHFHYMQMYPANKQLLKGALFDEHDNIVYSSWCCYVWMKHVCCCYTLYILQQGQLFYIVMIFCSLKLLCNYMQVFSDFKLFKKCSVNCSKYFLNKDR